MATNLFEGQRPERPTHRMNHSERTRERSEPRHAEEDPSSHVEASIIANPLIRVAVPERGRRALEPDTRPGRAFAISVQRVIATLVPAEGHLRIARAADALGLSVRTLQRRLAQEGLSFEELLRADRLAKATRLLETTSATVLEIALALGYSDHAHFTRAFHRWRGIAPLAYRRSLMSREHSHADMHARDQYAP
jgi:AraC-like DNA-binding protein